MDIKELNKTLEFALEKGAQQVRLTYSKSVMNLTGILNGEVDKTAYALDQSLQLQLFVDGRFGTFSSNRLEKDEIERFILSAIDTVRMLEPDQFRSLPEPGRLVKDALTGKELGLYDPSYEELTSARRKEMALPLTRRASMPAIRRLRSRLAMKPPWRTHTATTTQISGGMPRHF